MKILIVTPTLNGGGAERVAVNLANYYASQGFDTVLLAFRAIGPYLDEVSSEVNLIDLNASRARYSFFKLKSVIKDLSPTHILSVINSSNIMVGLAVFFNDNIRVVFREANTMDELLNFSFIKRCLQKYLKKLGYIRADVVIANSEDTKSDLVKNNIIKCRKAVVIDNPVLAWNYKDLMNVEPAHPWLLDGAVKVLLNVGRLAKQKNQMLLINAFSEIYRENTSIRLLILGEGEEKCNLENLIDKLKLRSVVEIISFQINPFVYYKNADIFVLTSEWEGFGNVIVEALACGIPVVSTAASGGPKRLLSDSHLGILTPCGNQEMLIKAILKYIDNDCVADESYLVNYAGSFSVDKVGDMYLKVIVGDVYFS